MLAFGTLAKLKSMSGQNIEWSDPQGATTNFQLYMDEVGNTVTARTEKTAQRMVQEARQCVKQAETIALDAIEQRTGDSLSEIGSMSAAAQKTGVDAIVGARDAALPMLKTHDTGDPSGRRQAIKEIGAWNARMKEEGKPQMTITLKDVMRRVKARRRQNRMSGKEREKGALQAETWGI